MSRLAFSVLLPLSLLVAASLSLLELRSDLQHRHAKDMAQALRVLQDRVAARSIRAEPSTSSSQETDVRSVKSQETDALQAAQQASNAMFSSAAAHVHYSGLLRRKAADEVDPKKRIEYFCSALFELGQALDQQPLHARILTAWANLRQMLGSLDCGGNYTSGNYQAVLTRVAEVDPTDTQAKYVAGLIYLWDGKPDQAHAFFRDTLLYATSLPPGQREFIHSQVKSAAALKTMIPGRFPQIEDFSRYVREASPRAFPVFFEAEFREELSDLQQLALQQSIHEYEQNKIPFRVHFERFLTLLDLVASQRVRKVIDLELGGLFAQAGQARAAAYSQERSNYDELTILRASLASDTRPNKTSLVNWGQDELLAFDNFYQTLGFYLPEEQTPKVIEIVSKAIGPGVQKGVVRLLVSADNQNWEELSEGVTQESLTRGAHSIIIMHVPASPHKYWKLHFASSDRHRSTANELNSLLRVYGLSTRKEAA